MLHTYAPAIFLVIVFILIRFSTVDTNTMCLRFRSDPLSRAFINRCVFGESTQRISVDGRPKRIARWCGRGLISVTKTFGRDPFNQNSDRSDRERWSTSKGGPVFSKLFRLDRTDPLKFWTEISGNVGRMDRAPLDFETSTSTMSTSTRFSQY